MSQPETTLPARVPGMMQIVNAVCKAAGVSSATIMGDLRREHLVRARAAVCKIASVNGYTIPEVMEYLNLNRTVGYHNKAKLDGHLRREEAFDRILAAANAELERVEPRATGGPKAAPSPPSIPETADTPPGFHDHDTRLGWRFTADEMERMHRARAGAALSMERLCATGRTPTDDTTTQPTHKPQSPTQ